MAGSGAKVIYPRNANNTANNLGKLEYYRPYANEALLSNNMEDDVVNQLQAAGFEKRMRALEELRNAARRNGGRFPYQNQRHVFEALSNALSDSKNDVRLLCVQLILEVIPSYADRGNLDECFAVIIPKLIPNLGDATVAFRRQIIQTLHVYMKHTSNLQGLLRAIVQYGLEYPDPRVKKEVIVALPMLFTPEFSKENFFEVAQSLAKRLLDSSLGEASVKQMILFSLEKIHKLVGDQVFEGYIQRLSTPLRRYYLKLTNKEDFQNEKNSSTESYSRRNSQQSNGHVSKNEHSAFQYSPTTNRHNFYKSNAQLEFGVVPSHVMDKLNDQTNFRTRAQAVEELKVIIGDLDKHGVDALSPNVLNFISFLNNLLDDSNFKITTVTLEILGILVQQLSIGVIRSHLKSHMSCLTKRMGDNKIVIRQAIMKVIMQLMQNLSPKPVLTVITENLSNRNSRVRQETLNIIIASLLTFPSYDFDLGVLCSSIAHTLVDPKRQVRQAALECFAVIAQAMGAGKLQPLVGAVDSVELSYEGDGVMAAVQARLTRRQLPKLNADGLVDYATPVPSSGTARGTGATPTGPDIEWILQGSGSSGSSARSTRSEQMDLESVVSSARSTPANFIQDTGPTPRRYPSAGKNRARLPWEDEQYSETAYSGRQGNSSAEAREGRGQVKPKTTWGGEDFGNEKNRGKKKATASGSGQEEPPEPGSYRQIHMNKYRRQMNEDSGSKAPYSVHGGRDSDIDSPTTAPFLPDWGEPADDKKGKSNSEKPTPIPTKPSLVRSVSSKRKVPPIPIDNSKGFRDDDGLDSARDSIFDDDEEAPDMNLSLRRIRNSASKKKVEKIFQRLESMESQQSRSPSPPSTAGESGIYSSTSTLKQDRNRGIDLPMESKPRAVARKTSPPPSLDQTPLATDSRSSLADSKQYADYKPHGGVTFAKNPNADVAIVGKGYADHPPGSEPAAGSYANKNKERKKQQQSQSKSMLSPLGMAATHTHGQTDIDDDKVPGGVVGKGMFETSPNSSDHSMSGAPSDRRERRVSRTESQHNLPRGVYGVRVRTNSQGQSSEDSDDSEEDDVASMSMSKSTREHLEKKFRLKQEEAERERVAERAERERERQNRAREQEERRRQEEDRVRREKERQQEKLRKLSNQASEDEVKGLAISGNGQQGSPPLNNNTVTSANGVGSRKNANKPTTTAKRKPKPPSNDGPPPPHPSSAKAGEIEPSENLKSFNDPHIAYTEAMKLVANEEWDIKCTGINHIRRLAIHHPDMLINNLHTVNMAIMQEVRNLRSQVSRLAIVCLGEMYNSLKRSMDVDLDQTTKVLLAKSGESNHFIREDVDQTMCLMVDCVTPQRAMLALINGGANHKNVAVRRVTSQYLLAVVERMGPGRVLSGIKDLTDRILPVASQFLLDPNAETRYNGQKMLYMLMSHEDFEKMMNKYVSVTTLRNIQDKLDNLKRKGLGDPPMESSSARARRSGQGSRSNSMTRGSSATSDMSQSSAGSRRTTRTDEATMDEIKSMCSSMAASDWRDRQKGIQQLLDMVQNNPNVIGNNINKVFDKFIPCLKDSNSKVNLFALKSMERLVPRLKDHMSGVISLTVQTISSNISSKNQDIYKAASDTLDLYMDHLDPSMLLQPFANQAQAGNARIKPDMINRVAFLTNEVYSKKQRQVILHVLPLLWHLLGSTPSSGAVPGGTGNLRQAITGLVQILYTCMGPVLLDHANNTSSVTPRMQQALQDMIDNP